MKFENSAPQPEPEKQKIRSKSAKSEKPKINEVLKEESKIPETKLADQEETKGMCIFIKILLNT